jgi:transketolase
MWEQGGISDWASSLPVFEQGEKIATRVAIEKAFNASIDTVPGLVTGAADLTGNTGTKLSGQKRQSAVDPGGRQIFWGVREHAMGAAMVGIAMHGGLIPAGGTFFVFSDYMRPAIRLASIANAKVVFVFSHDSVGVGEDGPTHQPVEQLPSLRAIPFLQVIRPADANETVACVACAASTSRPHRADPVEARRSGVHRRSAWSRCGGRRRRRPQARLVGTAARLSLCVDARATRRDGSGERREHAVVGPLRGAAEKYRARCSPRRPVLSVEAGDDVRWDATRPLDRHRRLRRERAGDVALRLGINIDTSSPRHRAARGPGTGAKG